MFIFKSNGQYLGFINGENVFDRDGKYLGWKVGANVWGSNGQYKGQLTLLGNNYYILRYIFSVSPIPQAPRVHPNIPPLPNPTPSNIAPIALQAGFVDGF